MNIKRITVGLLETNCYILTDDATGHTAVIDPGGDYEKILSNLAQNIESVKFILLTHAHIDHILAVNKLRARTKAKIAIHENDVEYYTDPRINGSIRIFNRAFIPDSPDIRLKDGDRLTLGSLTINVMHTPGHSQGSCCFICEDAIFSGDTLFKGTIGRTDFKGSNHNDMMKSLQSLYLLHGEYRVYPGHGEETTLAYEKEKNPYLRQFKNDAGN